MIKRLINNFFRIEEVDNHKIVFFCGIKVKFRVNKNGYNINGQNNKIIVVDNDKERELEKDERIQGLEIIINGNNNIIKINKFTKYLNSRILVRANCSNVCIGKSEFLNNLQINIGCGNSQFLEIGDYTNCWGLNIFLNEGKAGCIIGKNCLFSSPVNIWPSDGHVITEKGTQNIINSIKSPVIIGDNCWIGTYCILTKNAVLSNNTVCGAGSVITKKFEQEHILIAGNPAKIIKEGINWNSKTPTEFKDIVLGGNND